MSGKVCDWHSHVCDGIMHVTAVEHAIWLAAVAKQWQRLSVHAAQGTDTSVIHARELPAGAPLCCCCKA
jgi:hypothetical protein